MSVWQAVWHPRPDISEDFVAAKMSRSNYYNWLSTFGRHWGGSVKRKHLGFATIYVMCLSNRRLLWSRRFYNEKLVELSCNSIRRLDEIQTELDSFDNWLSTFSRGKVNCQERKTLGVCGFLRKMKITEVLTNCCEVEYIFLTDQRKLNCNFICLEDKDTWHFLQFCRVLGNTELGAKCDFEI